MYCVITCRSGNGLLTFLVLPTFVSKISPEYQKLNYISKLLLTIQCVFDINVSQYLQKSKLIFEYFSKIFSCNLLSQFVGLQDILFQIKWIKYVNHEPNLQIVKKTKKFFCSKTSYTFGESSLMNKL